MYSKFSLVGASGLLGGLIASLSGSSSAQAGPVTLPLMFERTNRSNINGRVYLEELETNVPGIFACGDARPESVKPVASAVGEGSISVWFIHQIPAES